MRLAHFKVWFVSFPTWVDVPFLALTSESLLVDGESPSFVCPQAALGRLTESNRHPSRLPPWPQRILHGLFHTCYVSFWWNWPQRRCLSKRAGPYLAFWALLCNAKIAFIPWTQSCWYYAFAVCWTMPLWRTQFLMHIHGICTMPLCRKNVFILMTFLFFCYIESLIQLFRFSLWTNSWFEFIIVCFLMITCIMLHAIVLDTNKRLWSFVFFFVFFFFCFFFCVLIWVQVINS